MENIENALGRIRYADGKTAGKDCSRLWVKKQGILGSDTERQKIISDKEAEEMLAVVRDLRKERGFR